jgi:hypothetical protein
LALSLSLDEGAQANVAGNLSGSVLARGARPARRSPENINPRIHREQNRVAIKLADENTFDAIYEKWLAHRELGLKKGRQTTLSILPRVFAKNVLPFLGECLRHRAGPGAKPGF